MSYRCKLTKKTERAEARRSCVKCGRIGHLATSCENPEKRHDKIGIEIEGYWRDHAASLRAAVEVTGGQGNQDGSLAGRSVCWGNDAECESCDGSGCDSCDETGATSAGRCRKGSACKVCNMVGWEYQTRPGSIGEALRQLTKMYPDGVSGACGMHVHMSFLDKSDITMLASEEFFAHFRAKFKEWGERLSIKGIFWQRLNGTNRYCLANARKDWTDRKADGACVVTDMGDRYRQINFLSYAEHETVEFRLLPMFQGAHIAVAAVEELVDIVEGYLAGARLDLTHDVEASSVISEMIPPVEATIPTTVEDKARKELLPEAIELEIDAPAMPPPTPGTRYIHAYRLAKEGAALIETITKDILGPANSKLRKLGVGTPTAG